MTTSDRTAVTGAPRGIAPRRGQVVGERYEIRGRLQDDPFTYGYLAFDQEIEQQVFLRLVRPELLDAHTRGPTSRRLRRLVGYGGAFLPGLIDADRDGGYVYVVSEVPEGASLREIVDRRRAEGRRFSPAEVLPVVAHLQAGLMALPDECTHGDVRPDNVWIGRERFSLCGPFVLPALPGAVVAHILQRDPELRRWYAPELLRSERDSAVDRYGVACIAHEMLSLEPPPEHGAGLAVQMGPAAAPLSALLHPDSALRSRGLDSLIEILALQARVPVPELEPNPFSAGKPLSVSQSVEDLETSVREAPLSAMDDGAVTNVGPPPEPSGPDQKRASQKSARHDSAVDTTSQHSSNLLDASDLDSDDQGEPDPLAHLDPTKWPTVVSSDSERTANLPEARKVDVDVATRVAVATEALPSTGQGASTEPKRRVLDGLDPRLVRAALAPTPEPTPHPDLDDSAIESSTAASVSEPDDEDLVVSPMPLRRARVGHSAPRPPDSPLDSTSEGVPLDPSVPVMPALGGTMELDIDEVDMMQTDKQEAVNPPGRVGASQPDANRPKSKRDEEELSAPLPPMRASKAALSGGPVSATLPRELQGFELEVNEQGVPLDPSVPVEPASDGTTELGVEDIESAPTELFAAEDPTADAALHAGQPASLRDLGSMAAEIPARKPRLVHAAPPPEPALLAGLERNSPRAGPVQASVESPDASSQEEPLELNRPKRVPDVVEDDEHDSVRRAGVHAAMPRQPPRSGTYEDAPRRHLGWLIVLVATLLAIGIVGGSLFYASQRKRQLQEEHRQRQYERLRQQGADGPD